jgi:hypothetical protein
VFCEGAHVLHNERGLFEDVSIDALKDEFFLWGAGDDVGVVDISVAKFCHSADAVAGGEFFCDGM